jgi:hypothetical protein
MSFNKSMMIASLLATTSIFADSCKPACEPCCVPHELLQCPTMPAYSAPARIDIQCGWDLSIDAGFIYWQAIEENLNLGTDVNVTSFTTTGEAIQSIIPMNWKYKPGFQVSLGYSTDYDNWDFHGEYTWFHNKQTRSVYQPLSKGVALLPNFGYPPLDVAITTIYERANQTWKLNMDLLDLDMGRWFYSGTQLTVRPYAGARVAWINQNLNVLYTIGTTNLGYIASSHSWAIGPRGGLDLNWNIGCGFRFITNAAADILFTRYTKINHRATSSTNPPFNTNVKDVNALRTHFDAMLGMGWGTYLCNHEWHFDINAGYEFQVFMDQNMLAQTQYGPINHALQSGNLYIHGLTLKARLDF